MFFFFVRMLYCHYFWIMVLHPYGNTCQNVPAVALKSLRTKALTLSFTGVRMFLVSHEIRAAGSVFHNPLQWRRDLSQVQLAVCGPVIFISFTPLKKYPAGSHLQYTPT